MKSFGNFNYLAGNINAIKAGKSVIPEKADVILDCKGALWHTVKDKKSTPKDLLQKKNLMN